MKLSKRLKHLDQMVASGYEHVWDCCCDHGFLGAQLLTRQAAKNIHFVDIVPQLMDELETKLQQFHADSLSSWKLHCLDVSKLPLDQYFGKHLVIIAGIGGDLMTQLVADLHQKYSGQNIDFLLCPVHRQFKLRQKLIELNFSLKSEILVEDNKRFYELILVSSNTNENTKISPVGDKLWKSVTKNQAENYLERTINHYQQIQKGNLDKVVDHIIDAYQSVVI